MQGIVNTISSALNIISKSNALLAALTSHIIKNKNSNSQIRKCKCISKYFCYAHVAATGNYIRGNCSC